MKHVMLFSFLAVCCSIHAQVFGQSTTTGDLGTDQRKVVWKTGATPAAYGTYGLQPPGGILTVGTTVNGRQRAFIQWSLPDELIPDGCTIDSVWLRFTAPPNGHSRALYFYLHKIPYDLTSSAPDSAMFESASEFGNQLYDGQYNPDYTVDLKWRGPTTLVAQAISEQLPSNRFTISVKASDEGLYYEWKVQDWTLFLTIWFTPQSTTLHQKLEDQQTEYRKVNLWQSSSFHEYAVPAGPFFFPTYSTQTVRADTMFASGTYQKHHDWNNPTNVINPGDHYVAIGTRDITSIFQTANNSTIQAQLIDGSIVGGSIDFKNPWLRDSLDSKGWLSRGTNAIYHSVSSGTNNVGTSTLHQGVFLNENPNFDAGKPNYSVGAPSPQGIGGYESYFINWTGTNVQYQNPVRQQRRGIRHTFARLLPLPVQ